MKKICLIGILCLCLLGTACEKTEGGGSRGKDWDYTVVPTADCPEEFLKEIETRKINAFQMTYDDGEYLYLAVGYGEQEKGGFSIQALGLYELGEALCLETSLNGPEEDEVVSSKPSFPYLVIKTQKTDKQVIFND